MKPRLRWLAALVGVITLLGAAAPAWSAAAEGKFERTLQVTGPVELDVTTGSGNITVSPGEPGRVLVRGFIHASRDWLGGGRSPEEKVQALEANPPLAQTGNVVRIGYIEDRELRRNVSISYELVVPVETRLKSDTGSGSQTIQGIRGPVKAGTGSGDLRLSDIGGDVDGDTGSGDIELDGIRGNVVADTGSGSIRALGIQGGFTADTGSGDVILEQTGPGEVKVDTGSGSVEIRGAVGIVWAETGSGNVSAEGKPAGPWKLSTGSGSIRLRVPAGVGFDFHARTGSGEIYTASPITVQGALKRDDLRGQVRGGGVLIELETGSGNIRIE